MHRDLVLAVLAVDASQIADWLPEGPTSTDLTNMVSNLRAKQLTISAVLWQQGEADARVGTSSYAYGEALTILIHRLRALGISAPILLARSTRCRNAGSVQVRDADSRIAKRESNVFLGPDTDTLGEDMRFDGCHFNEMGLDRAASMWVEVLKKHAVFAPN
jgi:lysophospholipase L1-like esterase